MPESAPFWRRHAAAAAAAVVVLLLYAASLPPTLSNAERQALAQRFAFTGLELASWEAGPQKTRRSVNPSLERHSGWISAVGAAVALADLDGDLLPEIYFANDFGPDRLFHNRSQPGAPRFALVEASRSFTKPRSKTLGQDSFEGMSVDFAD